LAQGEKYPLAALVLARRLKDDRQAELIPALSELHARLGKVKAIYRGPELGQAVGDAIATWALNKPSAANLNSLALGLTSANVLLRSDALAALRKLKAKPKAEDPVAYRVLIVATPTLLGDTQKWQAIELLRQWTGRTFGAERGEWREELPLWAQWFSQTFPKEPALPNMAATAAVISKYKYDDLLAFLEKDPAGRAGKAANGRKVFEKAQCFKCHRFGKEGEGLGPDLTTVAKRFKRADILESIYYPSKVISDQYRSVTITTKKGLQITGLAAPQGDKVTVLQSDGTKVEMNKKDIASQVSSLVSVMPEKLLDTLTKQEIADLFAFLESEPGK
jgi:putative heme-binding domain-containing protein